MPQTKYDTTAEGRVGGIATNEERVVFLCFVECTFCSSQLNLMIRTNSEKILKQNVVGFITEYSLEHSPIVRLWTSDFCELTLA